MFRLMLKAIFFISVVFVVIAHFSFITIALIDFHETVGDWDLFTGNYADDYFINFNFTLAEKSKPLLAHLCGGLGMDFARLHLICVICLVSMMFLMALLFYICTQKMSSNQIVKLYDRQSAYLRYNEVHLKLLDRLLDAGMYRLDMNNDDLVTHDRDYKNSRLLKLIREIISKNTNKEIAYIYLKLEHGALTVSCETVNDDYFSCSTYAYLRWNKGIEFIDRFTELGSVMLSELVFSEYDEEDDDEKEVQDEIKEATAENAEQSVDNSAGLISQPDVLESAKCQQRLTSYLEYIETHLKMVERLLESEMDCLYMSYEELLKHDKQAQGSELLNKLRCIISNETCEQLLEIVLVLEASKLTLYYETRSNKSGSISTSDFLQLNYPTGISRQFSDIGKTMLQELVFSDYKDEDDKSGKGNIKHLGAGGGFNNLNACMPNGSKIMSVKFELDYPEK